MDLTGLGDLSRKAALVVAALLDAVRLVHLGPEGLLVIGALGALASAVWVLLRPPRLSVPYRSDDPVVRALLADVAFLWTGDGTERRRVQLQKLSRLWKNPDIAADIQPDPDLRYEPLIGFYEQHVRTAPYFRGALVQRQVVIQLLEVLDREGDVPSVLRVQPVGDARDPENQLADTTFNLLTHTSLRDHALHVALEIIQRLTDQGARHIIPDAMIAALGHDVAKVPSQRRELMQTGDHCLAAGVLLTSLDGFEDLKHKDELLRAIKLHHRDPQDRLGKLLKQSEEAAREYEKNEGLRIAPSFAPAESAGARTGVRAPPAAGARTAGRAVRSRPEAIPVPTTAPAVPFPTSRHADSKVLGPATSFGPAPAKEPAQEPTRAGDHAPLRPPEKGLPLPVVPADSAAGEPPAANGTAPDAPGPDLSGWFDVQALIEEIAPQLNRPEGTKFPALTMPDGLVYVAPELLERAVRTLAERSPESAVQGAMGRPDELRALLLAVLEKLREAGCLDGGLLRPGELGARFSVSFGAASRTAVYVPFRVEVFRPWGTPEELEARKNSAVRRIRSVLPEAGETP